jgi:glyoxylase-like metal-dependent hydrolase (beta-lactamase superfamily II)
VKRLLILGMLTAAVGPRAVTAQNEVQLLPVQGNVHVLAGPSGNTTVLAGAEGPLLVDAQPAALMDEVLRVVRTLSPRPIRHIILTRANVQHAEGVARLASAGTHVRLIDSIDPRGLDTRATIIGHVNVLNRMNASAVPTDAWPTQTYLTPDWALFSNGEAVQLFHVPNARTDGDTIVFFRRSDVICAGGIYDATAFPQFDSREGGSIGGIIEGLNRVLDLAIPGENQEGGTVIVPGRGRLSDETDVANYRDMVTIVRDRVQALIAEGRSLDEVLMARPTLDYDGLFDTRSDWTAGMFVEAVYRDLSRNGR